MNRSSVCGCIVWLWFASPVLAGGEWFALTDFNSHSTSNAGHPAAQALKEHVADKQEFKCVAFTPAGDWVILSGANGIWTNNGDLPAVKKLVELQQGGQMLNCVAFTPHKKGWVVLCDRMSPHSSDIPKYALEKMEEFVKGGNTLRSITFLPNGEWVLLINENGLFYTPGIPDGLRTVLDSVFNKGLAIRCVASSTFGDWFVLTDKEYWTSNSNHPAAKRLAMLKSARRSLKWVVVAPEDPATAQFRLEVKPMQRVKAVLKTDAIADGKVEEFVIFSPEIPELPGQKDVRMTFSPEGQVVREAGPLQRPLILNRINDGRQEVRTTLTIEATIMSRQLRSLHPGEKAPAVPDLSAEQVKLFTHFSESPETNPAPLREWMERAGLKRKDGESDLVFAYRVFQYIKDHFQYESPAGDQSASAVCGKGKSDCYGLSNLFIAVLRDNAVPARKLIGRMANSGKMYDPASATAGSEGKEHVKAEFFARSIGWVPIDTAAAVSSPDAGAFAFFGNDPGDFITFSNDPYGTTDTFVAGKLWGVAAQDVGVWWRAGDQARKIRVEKTWTVTKEAKANPLPK